MTTFLLDSDILLRLQRSPQVDRLVEHGRLPVVVTDVVWDELTIGRVDRRVSQRSAEEARRLLQALAGEPFEMLPDTPEPLTFELLQDRPTTTDRGEHSIIAYALHHDDAVPVLFDGRALRRAVEELRGRRVLSIHGFLGEMHGTVGLGHALVENLSRWLCQADASLRRPLWWTEPSPP